MLTFGPEVAGTASRVRSEDNQSLPVLIVPNNTSRQAIRTNIRGYEVVGRVTYAQNQVQYLRGFRRVVQQFAGTPRERMHLPWPWLLRSLKWVGMDARHRQSELLARRVMPILAGGCATSVSSPELGFLAWP